MIKASGKPEKQTNKKEVENDRDQSVGEKKERKERRG